MNWIRKNRTPIIGFFIIALIIYVTLFAFNFLLYLYLNDKDGSSANLVETSRVCEEDFNQINDARKKGYTSMIYPELYSENLPYKEIAVRHKIAPLASFPNTDIYYCNEGYGQVRYKSDRYGFRNVDSLWDLNNIEITLIGDSFTHGACVGNDETISAKLNEEGLRTLNLGTGGNSPIHYAAIAKTFIKKIKSHMVVIIFYPNDNMDNEENSIYDNLFIKHHTDYFIQKNGKTTLSDNLSNVYKETKEYLMANAKIIDERRINEYKKCSQTKLASIKNFFTLKKTRIIIRALVSLDKKKQESLPYGSKLALNTLQLECKLNNCKSLIVYIPNSQFWRPDYRAKQYLELLKDYSKSHNIDFLDMSDEIKYYGKDSYAIKGPHLSPEGYHLIAKKISNYYLGVN